MENTKIAKEVDETLTGLIKPISSFTPEQINEIPFEGSWTAGQLAQHMIMANSGFVEIINGPFKETERDPDKWVPRFKEDFSNFGIKMRSPDFVNPETKAYNKEELLSALKSIREKILKAIETLDLTKTCMAFELPVYGYVTRLEAVYFVICHTQRHIYQLKNIQKGIK